MEIEFRTLRPDEIECRIGHLKKEGSFASILLYKDARVDMSILDETVGRQNWQRKHYDCKGNLFCSVGIKCGDDWVWKDDAGSESNVEKEKGEASDSFKRACTNWGIGRELYTSPQIWVKKQENEDLKYLSLSVQEIKFNENREISWLVLVDRFGSRRYQYGIDAEELAAQKEIKFLTESPICRKCGQEIKGTKLKDGRIITAQQVAEKTGSLCAECAKEAVHGKVNSAG